MEFAKWFAKTDLFIFLQMVWTLKSTSAGYPDSYLYSHGWKDRIARGEGKGPQGWKEEKGNEYLFSI